MYRLFYTFFSAIRDLYLTCIKFLQTFRIDNLLSAIYKVVKGIGKNHILPHIFCCDCIFYSQNYHHLYYMPYYQPNILLLLVAYHSN